MKHNRDDCVRKGAVAKRRFNFKMQIKVRNDLAGAICRLSHSWINIAQYVR